MTPYEVAQMSRLSPQPLLIGLDPGGIWSMIPAVFGCMVYRILFGGCGRRCVTSRQARWVR